MPRLAKASALQFGVNIVYTVVSALVTIYAVRILGASQFGHYALALGIIGIASIPVGAIIISGSKRISEGAERPDYYSSSLFLLCVIVIAVGVTLLAARDPLTSYIGFSDIWIIIVLFVSKALFSHQTGVLRGEQRVEIASLVDGGGKILSASLQFLLLYQGGSILSLLYGEVVGCLAGFLVATYLINNPIVTPTRKAMRSLYQYGRYAWLGEFRGVSYSWIDTVVLGFFAPSAVVGAYEVAWRVSTFFMLVPQALGTVIFPAVSRASAKERYSDVEQIIRRTLPITPIIAIPGVAGALVIGADVLSVYGDSVLAVSVAPTLLIVLSIGRVVEAYESTLVRMLDALDFPDRSFRIGAVFIISNLLLNLFAIPFIGAVGAAIATSLSVTISAVLAYRAFPTSVSVDIGYGTINREIVAATVMAFVLSPLTNYWPANNIGEVLAYVALGATIYASLLVVLSQNIRDRFRQLLRESGIFQ